MTIPIILILFPLIQPLDASSFLNKFIVKCFPQNLIILMLYLKCPVHSHLFEKGFLHLSSIVLHRYS